MSRRLALFNFFACALCAHSLVVSAEDLILHLTLHDAIRMAWQRHVQLIVAQERVQQALARLSQARSTLLPRVTGDASDMRQTRNLEASGITLPGRDPLVGPFNTFDARLKLTQTLLDVAAIQQLRVAKADEQRSLAESRKAKEDVTALVAVLYLEAQRAAQRLELARAQLEVDDERFRVAKTQLDLGTGSDLTYQQAHAAQAASRQQWQAAIADAIERRLDLSAALGLPSRQPIVFVAEDLTTQYPTSPDQDLTAALRDHPDIAAAQFQLKAREANRAAMRAAFLPTVSAVADYGASGKQPNDAQQTYTFGAQVSLPIFEGGLKTARVREASSQLRESEANLRDVTQHVEANVLSAGEAVTRAAAQRRAAEAHVLTAAEQLRLAQQQREAGTGSALDVVEARAQVAQARDQQEEADATYHLARINLAHAAGHVEQFVQAEQDMP